MPPISRPLLSGFVTQKVSSHDGQQEQYFVVLGSDQWSVYLWPLEDVGTDDPPMFSMVSSGAAHFTTAHVLTFKEWQVWSSRVTPPMLAGSYKRLSPAIYLEKLDSPPMSPLEAAAWQGFRDIGAAELKKASMESGHRWEQPNFKTHLQRVEGLIRHVLPEADDSTVAACMARAARPVDKFVMQSAELGELPIEDNDKKECKKAVDASISKKAEHAQLEGLTQKRVMEKAFEEASHIKAFAPKSSSSSTQPHAAVRQKREDKTKSVLLIIAEKVLPRPSREQGRCFIQPYVEKKRYQCCYEREGPGQKSRSGTFVDAESQAIVLRMLLIWAWSVHEQHTGEKEAWICSVGARQVSSCGPCAAANEKRKGGGSAT